MLEPQRHAHILTALERDGSVRTEELAAMLGVSGMTVRRDLGTLEEQGHLRRVHGGAVSAQAERPATTRRGSATARPRATIGMVTPSDSYYFGPVIAGAKRAARDLGCRLVLGVSDYGESLELRQVRRLLDLDVDGLLVTPSEPLRVEGELYETLAGARVPVVLVERDLAEGQEVGTLESVRSDYLYGARLAVRHLVELGHTSLALATRDTPTEAWVRAGFHLATHEFGIAPERIIDMQIRRASDHHVGPSLDKLRELLSLCRARDVHAALVLTDVDATALVDLAADRGMRVPDDLAIVAYDDEVAALASVPLTAVSPAKQDLGHLAFSMCFDRIREGSGASANGASTRPHGRIHLLPTLIVRESTVPSVR